MDENLLIEINGLSDGSISRHWSLGKEFFALFGNGDIRDGKVEADAKLTRSSGKISVDLMLRGSVTVLCDRCLSPLQVPVKEEIPIVVKFGEAPSGEGSDNLDDDVEEVFLPEEAGALDLGQMAYDYVCLAIPLRRVHPKGGCDESVARYIADEAASAPVSESPFAGLKDLLDAKK